MEIKRLFFDTEFIEDGKTIDLISIGIVCQDGREYYAVSNDCDLSKASDWVQQHVLPHLPPRSNRLYWKPRSVIRDEIVAFVFGSAEGQSRAMNGEMELEFWADYCSYDWVALCQLFGKMIDLPTGFPMFCNDIQQFKRMVGYTGALPEIDTDRQHDALADAWQTLERWEFLQEKLNAPSAP